MDLSDLNPKQREVILNSLEEDDRSIVVSGAGSGKTRVLVSRIAYLIEDLNVNYKSIMAITFTNKAANELKERLSCIISDDVTEMYIGTIHSICLRLLKELGSEIGITKVNIMDPNDSKNVMKEVLKNKGIIVDKNTPEEYLKKVSYYKNNMINHRMALANASNKEDMLKAEAYGDFQKLCYKRKIFDFDDLIVYTIALLVNSSAAREWVYDNIKYILIDECQDNSYNQFELLKILSGSNNVFLVGDLDQSLYSFRHAKPEYLLSYKDYYPNTKVFYLEQNYRSTKTIVEASNAVIKNNASKLGKTMFTENDKGDPIIYFEADNPVFESEFITREIMELHKNGVPYTDIAVLYRTNVQSRIIEETLVRNEIPHQIYGGKPFYDREEIKDILAFCKFYSNQEDVESLKRIFVRLSDGIGKQTAEEFFKFADIQGMDYVSALKNYPAKNKAKLSFINLFNIFCDLYQDANSFIKHILKEMDYENFLLRKHPENNEERMDNVRELLLIASDKNPTIDEFVNKVILMNASNKEKTADKVTLTTIHLAKGLEFSYVFLIGVENGILPHFNSKDSAEGEKEERNCFYVALTRAKKQVYISRCKQRLSYDGKLLHPVPSKFISEIPNKYLIKV